MINRIFVTVVSALSLVLITSASGQTVYTVESGTTSIRLDQTFLNGAGLTVLGVGATATPAPGFDAGFNIIDTTDFRFELNPGFAPTEGTVRHSGFVQFDQGTLGNFSVGNFRIEHGTVTPGKLELYDSFLGTRLFEIEDPVSASVTGNDLAFGDSDLTVTLEFASFLQTPSLVGQVAGQLRIDGVTSSTPIPEPHTALMVVIGMVMLGMRRLRD